MVQANAEGHSQDMHVTCQTLIGWYALTQHDDTTFGSKMRKQSTSQDKNEREMKDYRRETLYPFTDKPDNGCSREQNPQSRKPPGPIDILGREVCTLISLEYRSGCQYGNHYDIKHDDDSFHIE